MQSRAIEAIGIELCHNSRPLQPLRVVASPLDDSLTVSETETESQSESDLRVKISFDLIASQRFDRKVERRCHSVDCVLSSALTRIRCKYRFQRYQ